MALVPEFAVGTYVSIAMRIMDVQPRRTWPQHELYLHLTGVVPEGGVVGPLRLWLREAGDIRLGGTYVACGLKVVNGRTWKSQEGAWIRSDVPTFPPRVAAARLGCQSRMPSRLSQHE